MMVADSSFQAAFEWISAVHKPYTTHYLVEFLMIELKEVNKEINRIANKRLKKDKSN